jgi:predicted ester cyclase
VSVEANKTIARRFIEEVWNEGNLDRVDELMAPDAVSHDIDPTRTTDRAGVKAAIAAFRAAFPDLRLTIEDMFGEDDRVATRVTIRGTPTGEQVVQTWSGIGITRYRDGKIVEQWANTDSLAPDA